MYSGFCAVEWSGSCSGSEYVTGIPHGNQPEENSLVYEDGFKGVRGYPAEGHNLVFESNGYVLSNPDNPERQFEATPAIAPYNTINQRWVIHGIAAEGTAFHITSSVYGKYILQYTSLSL